MYNKAYDSTPNVMCTNSIQHICFAQNIQLIIRLTVNKILFGTCNSTHTYIYPLGIQREQQKLCQLLDMTYNWNKKYLIALLIE